MFKIRYPEPPLEITPSKLKPARLHGHEGAGFIKVTDFGLRGCIEPPDIENFAPIAEGDEVSFEWGPYLSSPVCPSIEVRVTYVSDRYVYFEGACQ